MNAFIADVRDLKSKALCGLRARRRRCASSSSEYSFLTDITGKFVVLSDMSKQVGKTMHNLLNGRERERERERALFCGVIFIDVRSLSTHYLD